MKIVIVSWTKSNGQKTKKHIEGSRFTLCGSVIPNKNKEYDFKGQPDCKRCVDMMKNEDLL